MASRNERALIASETMQVLSSGTYVGPSGKVVLVDAEIQDCVNETRL